MHDLVISRPLVGVYFIPPNAPKNQQPLKQNIWKNISRYQGPSFCAAIHELDLQNKPFILTSDSIRVCKWSPIVLGFKFPQNLFERSLDPCLKYPIQRILIGPLSFFQENRLNPVIVLIRGTPLVHQQILKTLGIHHYLSITSSLLHLSAVQFFKGRISILKITFLQLLNTCVSFIQKYPILEQVTYQLFQSTIVSFIVDFFLIRMASDMSMCRNSTVVPYTTGKGNISFFCIGGITWGKNNPREMTSGYPYELFEKVANNYMFQLKNLGVN